MIYKNFQGIRLSALGMGAMRLPVVNGNDSEIDEKAAATASRLPVALRSSASAKLYQKWSKTPELRGFRGFSFSNGLTQFDRTKPLLTRFLWVKWWTTTPKRGLMG
ncbi:MAG: hypothetical protein KHX22_08070 [Clostridiales bacterium]|nr:hypothetical protein [Clostridiales bacterium]